MSADISFAVKDIAPCRKSIEVSSTADKVTQLFNTVCKGVAQQAKLPGFRNGKAPRQVILQKYGQDIANEVREKIVRKAIEDAKTSEKLDLSGFIDVSEFTPTYKQDCAFTITLDVYPEITVPDYKSIKLETAEYVEDAAELEKALEEIATRFAAMEVVERAAAAEDFVKANYTTDLEVNDANKDLAEGSERWIPLTDNNFIPGATDALTGKNAGDKAEWTAEFPADFHNAELAAKSVKYNAEVIEVHGRNTPELTDELAKQAGAEDLADLTEKIKESIKNRFDGEQRNKHRDAIVDALLDGFECEVPQSLFEQEAHRQVHTIMQEENLTHSHDCNHEHTADCDHDDEDTAAQAATQEKAEKRALKDLKSRIILRQIAETEKVELNQYEVQMQLYSMAQHYGVSVEELTKQLQSTNSLQEFSEHVLMDKTLDTIAQIATGEKK
jgi:trigger factor